MLEAFIAFREEVILRRTAFDLAEARERAHIVVGLVVAVANIDEVIALIRAAADPQAAKAGADGARLAAGRHPAADPPGRRSRRRRGRDARSRPTGYRLSEEQAKAILELRLQRLTALERDKLTDELQEIAARIDELLLILRSRERLLEVMKAELLRIKELFDTPRRTFIDLDAEPDIDIEELIQREDMVVTVTHKGWIKRVPLASFRSQRRGGKGRAGMRTARRRFRRPHVRRQHPHAGPVLLQPRPGLQAQGLPPAAGHAAGARPGDDQHVPGPVRGREHQRGDAAARGRERCGRR